VIYRYVCPLCGFITHVTKEWKVYKCPSCQVTVQAIEYREEEKVDEQTKDPVH
jgi:ribosomal protein L37AE/L43A